MSNWTNPDHEKMLRDLWPLGMSRSQMATAINKAFRDAAYSRNAVIGKALRLGLPPTGRVSAPPLTKRRSAAGALDGDRRQFNRVTVAARAARAKSVLKIVGNGAVIEAAEPRPPRVEPVKRQEKPGTATILTLTSRMCKWPIGDPTALDFTFCGCKVEEAPYCIAHAKRAYQASTSNPRAAEPFQAKAKARFA